MKTCRICKGKYHARGLCRKHYDRLYRHSSKVKARRRELYQIPENKAKKRAYRQTPEYKAKMKVYHKAYNQIPENRANIIKNRINREIRREIRQLRELLKNENLSLHQRKLYEDKINVLTNSLKPLTEILSNYKPSVQKAIVIDGTILSKELRKRKLEMNKDG